MLEILFCPGCAEPVEKSHVGSNQAKILVGIVHEKRNCPLNPAKKYNTNLKKNKKIQPNDDDLPFPAVDNWAQMAF